MTKKTFFVFILIFSVSSSRSNSSIIPFQKYLEAADLIYNTINIITGNFLDEKLERLRYNLTGVKPIEQFINEKFDDVNLKLEQLDDRIKQFTTNLPQVIQNELINHDLTKWKSIINYFYRYAKYLAIYPEKFENKTKIRFAENFISTNANSPNQIMQIIYEQFVENNQQQKPTQFLKNIAEKLKLKKMNCYSKSQTEIFYTYYFNILLLEIKTISIITYGYLTLRLLENTNYTNELRYYCEQHSTWYKGLSIAFQQAAQQLSTEVFVCSTFQHIKGQTYEELTGIIQGAVIDQSRIDPGRNCYKTCNSYKFQTINNNDYSNRWKTDRKCNKVINCESIGDVEVCLSNTITKRYEYIRTEENFYGKQKRCTPKNRMIMTESQFKLFWKCAPCFCYCEEHVNFQSERYINLRIAKSDIKNNKVVIGVRFIKHNKIIHLQVKEGKIGPYGQIDTNTINWVPVENYKITDSKIYRNQDYLLVTYNERKIDLDNIQTPPGTVVTGVRFKRLYGHLKLQVLATPLNYTSGKLKLEESVYVDNPKINKNNLILTNPKVPTTCNNTLEIDSNPNNNQFIEFTNSDKLSDAAQSTIPFFDIQQVETTSALALEGVGIFHKGEKNCGGFLAPKIFVYNHFKQLQSMVNNIKIN